MGRLSLFDGKFGTFNVSCQDVWDVVGTFSWDIWDVSVLLMGCLGRSIFPFRTFGTLSCRSCGTFKFD